MFKQLMRVAILCAAAALPFSTWPVQAADKLDATIVLLGTGTPPPLMNRFGPATLVEIAGKRLLFDAGRGVTQRLWERRIPLGQVDHLFLTHLHSDHVVGIPDLWLTGWLTSPFGRRKGAFSVQGPKGTEHMMNHLEQAYSWDTETRVKDQKLPLPGLRIAARDIEPGIILDEDGVKVTAFLVDHGKLVVPAYGYRIDAGGRSIVISGDTTYSENLVKHAMGVDVLVHAIGGARPELLASAESWRLIMAHHPTAEDVGRVFAETRPKMAAVTHVVTLTNGKIPPLSPKEMTEGIRTNYDGPLAFGEDQLTIVLKGNTVTVLSAAEALKKGK